MDELIIGELRIKSPRLAYGCWRVAGTWEPAEVTPEREAQGRLAIISAYEAGYRLFDHADVYCHGIAESIFGSVLQLIPDMRRDVVIATKCGIRMKGDPVPPAPYRYDFSSSHIIWSCEQSLRRLEVETIDLYQLHRIDWLADPHEVAEAFGQLRESGKVREFGLSNATASQVAMFQKILPMKVAVNQVEVSLLNLSRFQDGTLDQCIAENIVPLAWSPLAGGKLGHSRTEGEPPIQHPKSIELLETLDVVAQKHGTTRGNVALAWLLKHPAGIVPIIGSINPLSIRESLQAEDIQLSREEWYRLLEASRGERLP